MGKEQQSDSRAQVNFERNQMEFQSDMTVPGSAPAAVAGISVPVLFCWCLLLLGFTVTREL